MTLCRPKQPYLESIISAQKKGCGKYYKLLMSQTYQKFNTLDKEKIGHKELDTTLCIDAWNTYNKLIADIKYDCRLTRPLSTFAAEAASNQLP